MGISKRFVDSDGRSFVFLRFYKFSEGEEKFGMVQYLKIATFFNFSIL